MIDTLAIFGGVSLLACVAAIIIALKDTKEKIEAYKSNAETLDRISEQMLITTRQLEDVVRKIENEQGRISKDQKIMLENVNMFLQGEEKKARSFGQQDIWG